MKKALALTLALILTLGIFAIPASALEATPTASTVLVNGISVSFDAYLINGNNYFKLRDLAYTLSVTNKKFDVGWDGSNNAISLTSGQPYSAVGGEMTGKGSGTKTPTPTSSKIIKDGKEVQFTAYLIEGNNYFKLRDIGAAFDFGVDWDGARNTIAIDTSKGYTPEATPTPTPGAEEKSAIIPKPGDDEAAERPDEPANFGKMSAKEMENLADSMLKSEVSEPYVRQPITLKKGATAPDISKLFETEISSINPGSTLRPRPGQGQNEKNKIVTKDDKASIKTLMDLGRGYDIFDRFASGLSLRNAVLDVDKLIDNEQIQRSYLGNGDFVEIEGETLEKYSKDMSTQAKMEGGYTGFKASLEISFSSSYRSESTSYYNTINYLVRDDNLFIKGSCNYKDYILPDVKEILDTGRYNGKTYTPAEIFQKYGGYVLVDGIFGGRLEYNVAANSQFVGSFKNFKANVKTSFNMGAASASGELDHEEAENRESFNKNSSTTVITYGGTAQDGRTLAAGQQSATALSTWRDSIPGRTVLVDFGKTGALVPIWELCSTTARANELKKAFDDFAKGADRTINFPPPKKYISDIAVISGSSRGAALSQIDAAYPGWIAVDVDLNKGSGGEYIYLIYKQTEDFTRALGDIFLEYRTSAATAATETKSHNGNVGKYIRKPVDLNKGVGKSNWIYLWWAYYGSLTTMQQGVIPITQIEVVLSLTTPNPDGWTYVKWQNTTEPADCNKSAKGEYIYIRYK